jgi:hypothetical protein
MFSRVNESGLPRWTWPALWLDRIRPGLAEWAARDVAWLARFPVAIRSMLIPLVVVLIPITFAAMRAFDQTRPGEQLFAVRILDVYTESIPFMVIAALIGLAAPTLGVLFLAAHAVADLIAAAIQPSELKPLPTALLGRLVSFWLLYLLVAELPIAVHEIIASVRKRGAGTGTGTVLAVLVGGVAATALAWMWGGGAPLLIRPVFTWSALGRPSANAGWPLLVASDLFAYIVGALALVLFVVRYVLLPATAEPIPTTRANAGSAPLRLVFGVLVPIILFASVVTQPIDALVLVSAVIAARPISVLVLRGFGLARRLAVIPRPARLIGGFALSAAVGFGIASVLGVSTLSDWFTMNVVMAVGFVLTRVLLDADDFVQTAIPGPSLATGVVASIAAGVVIWLFSAGWAFADNTSGQSDGYGNALGAAAAAGGAGGLAAWSAGKAKGGKKPNPPPWYIPDNFADWFGYDPPKPPPPPPPPKPKFPKPKTPDGPIY